MNQHTKYRGSFKLRPNGRNVNREVRGLTKEVSELKAQLEELVRQRVTATEPKETKPKDAEFMSQAEFFDSIDELVASQGFDYSEPEEGFRQTYITNEYTLLPFASFCSMLYLDVTAGIMPNHNKITLPDFVTYCCVVLQLMLTANPDVIGHAGVTFETCQYAKQRLQDLIIPDVIYFAMQSFKPFITEDGRTKVIFSPFQWATTENVDIPVRGPVPVHNVGANGQPGGNRVVSDIDLKYPVYSVISRTGQVVIQDQRASEHVVRADPISSYLVKILPLTIIGPTALTSQVLNAWIEDTLFDRPVQSSLFLASYRNQPIEQSVLWITTFLCIGEQIQSMSQFSNLVRNPGTGMFQQAHIKKCPGHIVENENHQISFISQNPREKFVPVFVVLPDHENTFANQLRNVQIGGAGIRESLIKESFPDQRRMLCSFFDLGRAYSMLVRGDPGPLKCLLKSEFT